MRDRLGGLTLVEMLVTTLVLSLMALMGWRGLDALIRSDQSLGATVEQTSRARLAVSQLDLDLQNLTSVGSRSGIEIGPDRIRFVRSSLGGVQVVVWGLDRGVWWRWASPPVQTPKETEQWWQASSTATAVVNESAPSRTGQTAIPLLTGIRVWRIQAFRSNAWAESDTVLGTGPSADWPDALRIEMDWQVQEGAIQRLGRIFLLPVRGFR
jgi:general secretion pathway protein J